MTEQEIFLRANDLLRRLLEANKPNLDLESIEAVSHYLDHDEYEMAFEGLFVDLMTLERMDWVGDIREYFDLGKELGLETDSVFDAEFWDKFAKFLGSL